MLKECKTMKAKTNCNSHNETSKKAGPRKRWKDKVQENVKITGTKTVRQLSKTVENGGRLYWKPRSIEDLAPEK